MTWAKSQGSRIKKGSQLKKQSMISSEQGVKKMNSFSSKGIEGTHVSPLSQHFLLM